MSEEGPCLPGRWPREEEVVTAGRGAVPAFSPSGLKAEPCPALPVKQSFLSDSSDAHRPGVMVVSLISPPCPQLLTLALMSESSGFGLGLSQIPPLHLPPM